MGLFLRSITLFNINDDSIANVTIDCNSTFFDCFQLIFRALYPKTRASFIADAAINEDFQKIPPTLQEVSILTHRFEEILGFPRDYNKILTLAPPLIFCSCKSEPVCKGRCKC